MKIASIRIVVILAGMGAFLCGQARAEQWRRMDHPSPGRQAAPEAVQEDAAPMPANNEEESAAAEDSWIDDGSQCAPRGLRYGGCGGMGCSSPCCEQCGGGSLGPADWTVEQEVRILMRDHARRTFTSFSPAAVTSTTVISIPELSTRSLSFNAAAGYDATVRRYLGRDCDNRDHFAEFTYWGMNHWSATRQATATTTLTSSTGTGASATFGNLFSPFPSDVGGFNRAQSHTLSWDSEIHNFELNGRISPRGRPDRLVLHPDGRWCRECQPGCYTSYLFGLRALTLDEDFSYLSQGVITTNNVAANVSGNYHIRTHNNLIGLQIGADIVNHECKWEWGVSAKAGPYLNMASQDSDVTTAATGDPFATQSLNIHRHSTNQPVSFIGECSFVGRYNIRPNFALKASYDFMWITSLALGPDQLVYQTTPPAGYINSGATVFFEGISLGFDWTW